MFLSNVLNMAPKAAFAILCILGEILHKQVQGGICINPLEKLHKNKTLNIQSLFEMINSLHLTYFQANNYSQNTRLGMNETSSSKRTMEICVLTSCFNIICLCSDAKNATSLSSGLNKGDASVHCIHTRKKERKNELEKQNSNEYTKTQDNDVSFPNATIEPLRQKKDFRFQPLLLAVAFILGTIFGCVVNKFAILFCRKRQSKKQMDSLEDIQMYTKFVGETSAYSEISESNRNGQEVSDAGANTGEYMEPISKNTILQKALTSLADQEENRENNAYFTLTLDRRQADGDGYNHLKPNTGRLPTSPVNQENDLLYHTMAGAKSQIAQVDNEPAENPVILEKGTDDDCNTQSSDVESEGVQGEGLQDERPYSMCIHVRDITGDDDTDSDMQERNETTNTEDAYFVLEKQIV